MRARPSHVIDLEALLAGSREGRTRQARETGRRGAQHLPRLTPAVFTAVVAVDVLVVLAAALLPGARGSAMAQTFLVPPSVVVAGWGSRGWTFAQSAVVLAGCAVVLRPLRIPRRRPLPPPSR